MMGPYGMYDVVLNAKIRVTSVSIYLLIDDNEGKRIARCGVQRFGACVTFVCVLLMMTRERERTADTAVKGRHVSRRRRGGYTPPLCVPGSTSGERWQEKC